MALVDVAVPVTVDRGFTYEVPPGWPTPEPGTRVLVPFGTRALIGVVRPNPSPERPPGRIKPLLQILDHDGPALSPPIVALCEWLQDYYVSPVGETYRLALPGLLTGADARVVVRTEAGDAALTGGGPLLSGPDAELSKVERRLLEHLPAPGEKPAEVLRLRGIKPKIPGLFRLLGELEARGLCSTEVRDAAEAGSRTETHVRRTGYLRGAAADEDALKAIVGRSKQRRGLLDFLEGMDEGDWISLSELRGPFPRVRQLLPPLVEAELVVSEERPRELDPFASGAESQTEPQTPTADQAAALEVLIERMRSRKFCSALLHGITGSGKTEVYLQLIAEVRAEGGGAIVLVPEIALTPQLADRFRARFGDQVAVLHSGLTPRQRLDAWHQIRGGERPIVIGARSAIFAPVPDLRVIVVDEEHDGSFKQEEGVRYHARDVALVRGKAAGGLVVLGTATPSLETYSLAQAERHLWLRLKTRPTPRPLPEVEIIPLSVHKADPESMMTARLRDAIAKTVEAGEQAILFLNRRGFTTSLLCASCGAFVQCPDCSAPSMTYHLSRHRLMCHLCGHLEAPPDACAECGATELTHGGVGTERVEVALGHQLPGVRVLRLDRDAARGRQLLGTLAKFRAGEADVLIGTQMLSKGHDFPGVTLVGVLSGDHGLGLPDPRAAERTFQLLTQVAGRAGRGDRPGRVLIQAYSVAHPAITFAAGHDFEGFAAAELEQRRDIGNPPFGHLALIRIQGPAAGEVEQRAKYLGERAGELARIVREKHEALELPPLRVLGPVPSPIERINRRSRWQLLLRASDRGPLRWALERLRADLGQAGTGMHQTLATVDVDPQSLL